MKKTPSYLKAIIATLIAFSIIGAATAQQKSVALTAITDHPSLEAVRDGVKETLENAGYVEGKNLHWQYQSAQGNTSIAAQIARKFVGDRPDVIVAISTPSAQTMMSATKTVQIPVIYTAVTDPVSSKLVNSWDASGTNITGVSDKLDLEKQVDLILQIVPDAKRIGIVYNTAEVNSDAVIKSFEEIFAKRGLTLFTAAAPRTVDVGSAAQSLVGKVDVFYATTDNNVVSAMEALVKVGQNAQIPVIASDPPSVERGAVAALGVDYKELGHQAGQIILRIFDGEKPGDIASQTLETPQLYLNPSAAKKQGITLPDTLLEQASVIVD